MRMAELAKVEVAYLNELIKVIEPFINQEAYKPYHDETMSSLNERLENASVIAEGKPLYTYNVILAEDNGDEIFNDEKMIVSSNAREIAKYINDNMRVWADTNSILLEGNVVTSENIDAHLDERRDIPYIFKFGDEGVCSIMITVYRIRIN